MLGNGTQRMVGARQRSPNRMADMMTEVVRET